MKKIIGLALVALMLMTACTPSRPSKTEEELKAEIKAELKAEMQAAEDVTAEDLSEEVVALAETEGVADLRENTVFAGLLSSNTAPYFLVLTDAYNPIIVDDKEYTSLAFDAEKASKYLDRDQFSYHLEGFPIFSGKYNYLEIEFDLNAAYESMGYLRVDDYKVLSYNYGPLENKSSFPYPNSYYQEIIKTLGLGVYGAEEVDIKNNEGYNNEVFKAAVDLLENQGYKFVQHGNYYQVINEKPIQIDHVPSVNELCMMLGIEISDLNISEDGGYFMYSSNWIDEDIEFMVYHDEPLKGDEKVSLINVNGLKYELFGLRTGMNVNEAFELLKTKYGGMYSHHSDTYAEYVFNVEQYAFTLNHIGFDEVVQIGDNELVLSMSLYELLD